MRNPSFRRLIPVSPLQMRAGIELFAECARLYAVLDEAERRLEAALLAFVSNPRDDGLRHDVVCALATLARARQEYAHVSELTRHRVPSGTLEEPAPIFYRRGVRDDGAADVIPCPICGQSIHVVVYLVSRSARPRGCRGVHHFQPTRICDVFPLD
ncbi:hypothetical protein QAD02_002465 [Eretmocerus hayati]|uniref:Uncharacterized protein n=1 Tax=Eretmocerus hayati TaxID=131215 RepID=A0ACC2NJW5_9HYME|nr:hypothetical protein QAD02_002465 [Eretmocerus hayati]